MILDILNNIIAFFDPSNLDAITSQFLGIAGDNPVFAMLWLFLHGGWVIFLVLAFYAGRDLWLDWRQGIYASKRQFILLAIDVPRMSEQTVKAVENMFAHLAGAHGTSTFYEKWVDGKFQDNLSFEIVSIEGHVQYLVRTIRKLRDLVEASVYAQYPDAEITEVEDYSTLVPEKYPNDTHELYGTELTPVASDVYPLKTYEDFEHGLTGEFKDPLAVLLEAFSRLGPGEQAWYQILITPIAQKDFVKKAKAEIGKLAGREAPKAKKGVVDTMLDVPLKLIETAGNAAFGGATAEKKKEDSPFGKMMMITPGERKIIEALENKMSKLQYLTKIRFIYVAKKEVFSKPKILQSFVGSIKQFNTNDMQALKPDGDYVGMSASIIFMKERRNNIRKEKVLAAYRGRSSGVGLKSFHLGVDELASLWHLPVVLNVKAPQLKKTEAKKVEPPINLPFV